MIVEIKETSVILEFIWRISQDKTKNSYPKFQSKDDLKQTIERANKSDTQKVIGCFQHNKLKGVSIYSWEKNDIDAQTIVFMIEDEYVFIANEIIDYIKKELPGYKLLIGVPFENVSANTYFRTLRVKCIESCYDTRLRQRSCCDYEVHQQIEPLNLPEIAEYAVFHNRFENKFEMYWTSERLKEHANKFRIYIYRNNGKINGSILVKKYNEGAEVFGLFLDKESKNQGLERELIRYMLKSLYEEYSDIKEIVYFIREKERNELEAALEAEFEIQDTYKCYKYEL